MRWSSDTRGRSPATAAASSRPGLPRRHIVDVGRDPDRLVVEHGGFVHGQRVCGARHDQVATRRRRSAATTARLPPPPPPLSLLQAANSADAVGSASAPMPARRRNVRRLSSLADQFGSRPLVGLHSASSPLPPRDRSHGARAPAPQAPATPPVRRGNRIRQAVGGACWTVFTATRGSADVATGSKRLRLRANQGKSLLVTETRMRCPGRKAWWMGQSSTSKRGPRRQRRRIGQGIAVRRPQAPWSP